MLFPPRSQELGGGGIGGRQGSLEQTMPEGLGEDEACTVFRFLTVVEG